MMHILSKVRSKYVSKDVYCLVNIFLHFATLIERRQNVRTSCS
jgi:hypothetical protein